MSRLFGGELLSAGVVAGMDADIAKRTEALRVQGVSPHLVILTDNPKHRASQTYMEMKCRRAIALGMQATRIDTPSTDTVINEIAKHNDQTGVHGIIVQLPSSQPQRTAELTSGIMPRKDVDGLGLNADHQPATGLAILKLLGHYGVDPREEKTALLGRGLLVNAFLERYLSEGGAPVKAFDIDSDPLEIIEGINEADIIISAMGQPGLLTPDLFTASGSNSKTLVDAGTTEMKGVLHGDMSDELREYALSNGWLVTPLRGGVGPLTVRTLLEHTVTAAESALALV